MEANLPKTTSQNLSVQSKGQKSLLDFAKTNEETNIIICLEGNKAIGLLENPQEKLIDIVSKWRMYIGMPKNDVSEELIIVAQYIYENYPNITIAEIDLAVNLSIRQKLKDSEFHGYFSPMYVAKVLDSYLHYRRTTLSDAMRRRDNYIHEQLEKANKPSPEQQAKDFREIIRGLYKELQETDEIRDPFTLAYNYLRRTKMLLVTKAEIEEAQKYAKNKTTKIKQEGKIRFELNYEREEIKLARNWCVQNYFKNVNIDILLNNIKAEHFN
jgi:hypothetical protein